MIKTDYYKFIEHYRNNKWGDDYIFMEEEGKAIGRVYIYKDNPDIAYIEGLHVSEKERLKTIGSELLNKLITKCKDLGAKECMLWCYKNSWLFYWYQRLGFKFHDNYEEENAIWMIKSLNNKIR